MPNSGQIKSSEKSPDTRVVDADDTAIAEAARHILDGGLVAFPTETVYGLGADATNGEAVAGIFAAKGRPQFNPLIVHVPNLASAHQYGNFSPAAVELAEAYWPGPLTLVVPRRTDTRANNMISHLVSAGLDTLALRVPVNPIAQSLLHTCRRPLAAPSANRSGHVSSTRADHVAADLANKVAMILDGGPTLHGMESTIIDATGPTLRLLRPGAITRESLEAVIGVQIELPELSPADSDNRPSAPGQLESHYAPRSRLRLNCLTPDDDEAVLGFGPMMPTTRAPSFNLSSSGDLTEAAANLFAALRSLDSAGFGRIAAMPVPNVGLGIAINDRLQRAAAPRPSS